MAKAYKAPTEPPTIETDDLRPGGNWQQIEQEYVEELAQEAKRNGKSPLLGKEIRFPRGDGYARYLVWRTQPLELIWLELGDAWSVEDALIRGLRVKDIREMVEQDEALAKLFSSNK